MRNEEIFTHLGFLNQEVNTLTFESEEHIKGLKMMCRDILRDIDGLKTDIFSDHITMTKGQAKRYINKGLAEIEKYNTSNYKSPGNFTDVINPIHAGLELLLNLDY